MKKIIRILVLMLCISSCNELKSGYTRTYADDKVKVTNITTEPSIYNDYVIKDITYNNETHEYIEYHGIYWFGLSHWAGCKYCKEKYEKHY